MTNKHSLLIKAVEKEMIRVKKLVAIHSANGSIAHTACMVGKEMLFKAEYAVLRGGISELNDALEELKNYK